MNSMLKMKRFWLISLMLALTLAACQMVSSPPSEGMPPATEDQAPTSPTAGVEAEVSPTPENLPETGAPDELTPVIDAVLSGDLEAKRALVEFTTTACSNAEGLGGPPKCLEGEEEGATVEAFPVSAGEGTFVRPEEIDGTLDFKVDKLYAVYRIPEGDNKEAYWPAGEYGILFEHEENGSSMPVVVRVEKGRIVRLDFHFGMPTAAVLESIPDDHILLRPEEVEK